MEGARVNFRSFKICEGVVSAWTGLNQLTRSGKIKLSADTPWPWRDGPGSLLTKPKSDLRDKGRTIFLLCAALERDEAVVK